VRVLARAHHVPPVGGVRRRDLAARVLEPCIGFGLPRLQRCE
jgi:hypothetical protein